MANIPNFLDVNRKKIEFFSASNVIRTKGNIVAGPGPVLPYPSPTPTLTPTPSITPTITPTVTPTTTQYQYAIVGSGILEQLSVAVNPGFTNSVIYFNGAVQSFDPESMGILYNGQPSTSITYNNSHAGQTFVYYPGTGSRKFIGVFANNSIVNFTD
jgi:hypothetical protein